MAERNDGGPAFVVPESAIAATWTGMTLLDYFAAAAMQGQIAAGSDAEAHRHLIAQRAYGVATAMLAARDKS